MLSSHVLHPCLQPLFCSELIFPVLLRDRYKACKILGVCIEEHHTEHLPLKSVQKLFATAHTPFGTPAEYHNQLLNVQKLSRQTIQPTQHHFVHLICSKSHR